jgi:Glycerol kinase
VRLIEADLETPIEQLHVDGGLAASDQLLQIQSDLLGVPVHRSATQDATSLGVAELAALGVGSAIEITPATERVFEPQLARDETEGWFARWRAASNALSDLGEST